MFTHPLGVLFLVFYTLMNLVVVNGRPVLNNSPSGSPNAQSESKKETSLKGPFLGYTFVANIADLARDELLAYLNEYPKGQHWLERPLYSHPEPPKDYLMCEMFVRRTKHLVNKVRYSSRNGYPDISTNQNYPVINPVSKLLEKATELKERQLIADWRSIAKAANIKLPAGYLEDLAVSYYFIEIPSPARETHVLSSYTSETRCDGGGVEPTGADEPGTGPQPGEFLRLKVTCLDLPSASGNMTYQQNPASRRLQGMMVTECRQSLSPRWLRMAMNLLNIQSLVVTVYMFEVLMAIIIPGETILGYAYIEADSVNGKCDVVYERDFIEPGKVRYTWINMRPGSAHIVKLDHDSLIINPISRYEIEPHPRHLQIWIPTTAFLKSPKSHPLKIDPESCKKPNEHSKTIADLNLIAQKGQPQPLNLPKGYTDELHRQQRDEALKIQEAESEAIQDSPLKRAQCGTDNVEADCEGGDTGSPKISER
ncbi:hypothetical protein EV360DRAFT_66416 [Lentinula raphanica]|nr:hypothetical protein EV360DRAFT_66416 [Lentinula raphanica]